MDPFPLRFVFSCHFKELNKYKTILPKEKIARVISILLLFFSTLAAYIGA
jgi:hypothetical protein